MLPFVGREAELLRLKDELERVGRGGGRLLVLRGRRQVGKSTLVEEFLSRSPVPSVFFSAASGAEPATERATFAAEVAGSTLEAATTFTDATFATWEAALRAVGASVTRPTVVVLDEFPFLMAGDPAFEGTLQRVWDRQLSRLPLLLILVGSDLAAMEMLSEHDRPLYGRTREMVLDPLHVRDVAELMGVDVASAFDVQLVTGGLPRLVGEMRTVGTTDPVDFVANQLRDSTSPLVVLGERSLAAEFPSSMQARDVLAAVGAGSVAFSRLADRTGIPQASLNRTLRLLADKRVVAAERPLSRSRSTAVQYRVRDPYLRFWLGFVRPELDRILRGRGEVVARGFAERWPAYAGSAVEPLVRAAVERTLPRPDLGSGSAVGRYWSRDGRTEADIIVADRPVAPARVTAIGSIKWRVSRPFDRDDLAELHAARVAVPGADEARTLAVSRAGFTVADVDVTLAAADLA